MSRLTILLTALVIGSAAGGCGRTAGLQPGSAQAAAGAASLQVSNSSQLAMDIYVRANGITHRLGTVSPGLDSNFVLQPEFLRAGTLELFAQPIGGGRVIRSGPLALSPGGGVDFYIGLNAVDSRITIH